MRKAGLVLRPRSRLPTARVSVFRCGRRSLLWDYASSLHLQQPVACISGQDQTGEAPFTLAWFQPQPASLHLDTCPRGNRRPALRVGLDLLRSPARSEKNTDTVGSRVSSFCTSVS